VTPAADARERRRRAAARFKPDLVDTLLVDEAPPSALDRYFYFEDVDTHDSLFRYVVRAALGESPTRDKTPYLHALRDQGWFLIDAVEEPFRHRRDVVTRALPDLVRRIRALSPERVVLIGARLYDEVYDGLRSARVPVADVRLPYPGSGQQRRFLDGFAETLGGHA